jgi:hypothetical protein
MRRIIVPPIQALVMASGTAFAVVRRYLVWKGIENKQGGALKRLLYLAILSMAALLISAPTASAQDEMTSSIQDFSSIRVSLPSLRGRRSRGLTKERRRIPSLRRTGKSSTLQPYNPATRTRSRSRMMMRVRPTPISARSILR